MLEDLMHTIRRMLPLLGALALAACGDSDAGDDPDSGSGGADAGPLAALCVNELMAENAFTLVVGDPPQRPDWIELHNPSGAPIDLAGFTITDDLSASGGHYFNDSLIVPAGGFLLLYADGAPQLGPEHLDFALDKGGDEIGLFDPAGRPVAAVAFGRQVTDWSQVNEGGAWSVSRTPTPGASNGADCAPQPDPKPTAPDTIDPVPNPSDEIYDLDTIQEFHIELSDAAIEALVLEPYVYVQGSFTFEGRTYGPVGVRLKGQGSFKPITGKSSFKIDINEYVPGAEFMELKKLTFNNMSSDPTMMRERLAYLVFRESGAPAPRCNYARVYVNDTYYGLYANLENVETRMLTRWFEDETGPLYEGWDVDFKQQYLDKFEHEDGPDDRTNIQGLIDALALEPASAAIAAAADHADVDQFRLFWAVTVAVGQFDAYPYHFDDFHIYDDPVSGGLHFIPWGADESWNRWGNAAVFGGLIAERCWNHAPCKADWIAKLRVALDLMDDLDVLGQVDAIAAQIEDAVAEDVRRPYDDTEVATRRQQLRDFISARRTTLTTELGLPF